jgi:hypothetical protein
LGGTDGNNSKIGAVAKKDIFDDPQKIEESPPGA